jgi:Tripartite tricarboxylate transporter family receptor/CBS domain
MNPGEGASVATATRWEGTPDIPTVDEFVPGYEASVWFGVGAPKNMPPEIVEKLDKEINAGLADPGIKTRLTDLGGTALPGSPADRLKRAMTLMINHRVRHLIVIGNGQLVGIVSIGDVVKYRLEDLEAESNVLRDAYIAAH